MLNSDKQIADALKATAERIHPPAALKQKVMKQLELSNAQGDRLALVTVDSFDAEDPMDRIIRQLRPGMGKAIYVAANNPDRTVSNQTCYEAVPWNGDLADLRRHAVPYSFRLPESAELEQIFVMHGFDGLEPEEIERMALEAEARNLDIVVRDLPKNDRLVGAQLLYMLEGVPFELHLLTTTKNRIHVPDLNEHIVEKTKVAGKEAVYLANPDSSWQQLLWVDDDSDYRVQYEIRTSHPSKPWVFALAEQIME